MPLLRPPWALGQQEPAAWGNAPSVGGREAWAPHPGYSAFDLGSVAGRRARCMRGCRGRSPKGVSCAGEEQDEGLFLDVTGNKELERDDEGV